MPSASSRANVRLALAVLAVAALGLGLHAYRYMPFICDDALISLRYTKRLLDGQGLTWNSGERVEGYSNLLWVLSAAALGWLGVDLITSVRILGVAGMVLSMAAVLYAYPPSSLSATPVTSIALLFLALSSAFAVWAIGGMEQPFVAALLAWAVVLCFPHLESRHVSFRQLQWPGLCLALLCLTRPDAPLFTAAAVLAMVVVGGGRREAFEKGIALATLPVLFFLGQLTFRLFYYGEWVPEHRAGQVQPVGTIRARWVAVRRGRRARHIAHAGAGGGRRGPLVSPRLSASSDDPLVCARRRLGGLRRRNRWGHLSSLATLRAPARAVGVHGRDRG